MRFPLMVFRDGKALPEHGVDYLIVSGEAELADALRGGWREGLEAQIAAPRHPLDLDGDGEPGGSLPKAKRGRKPKVQADG